MKSVETQEEFRTLSGSDKPFVALFSADRCADCRVLKAVLPGIEEQYGERFEFAVVDRDKHDDLAQEFNILGIPSFVALRNGEIIGTYIDGSRKSREQITAFLDGLAV